MMFDKKLARALNFTEDDLAANRSGQLNIRQRSIVRKKALISILRNNLFRVTVSLWLILSSVSINHIIKTGEGTFFDLLIILPPGLLLLTYIFNVWRQINLDLAEGVVAMDEGIVQFQLANRNGDPIVRFPHISFPINGHIAVFRFAEPYRAYYAPHTKQILSAEPME
jgi:hypothetical protein